MSDTGCRWERMGLGGGKLSAFPSAVLTVLIHGDCGIRRLASPAPLTLDTFHTTLSLTAPPGSISPTFGEQLSRGGGREPCWLCKGSYLPLLYVALYFFLPHSPPTFISHMAPGGAIIWQHPPPTHNHLLPHDKHAHAAVTPQENALTSSGCTTHLITGGEQQNLWAAARLRVTTWWEHIFLQASYEALSQSTPAVMNHLFMKRKNNLGLDFKRKWSKCVTYECVKVFSSGWGHV